ncbi:MAG: ABC transporter ATP-binding protein [Bacilli bacterium]|jgi:ABC-type lipoprotein export system ATPase subunit
MIKLVEVSKYYHENNIVAQGMRKVSLDFDLGEFVAITGESGSGKSTLLNVISGVDTYEDGEMLIDGIPTSGFDEKDWDHYRRNYIGFIFQNYHLIDSYTVYENVESALVLTDVNPRERKKRINDIIARVGLSKWKNQRAARLSGGQKQRVAIARALAKNTPIIVADEPTGNLDAESGKQISALLGEIAKNKLVIVVSHNYPQIEPYATRKIKMVDGEVIEDRELKTKNLVEKDIAPLSEPVKKKRWHHALYFAWRNLFRQPKRSIFIFIVSLLATVLVAINTGNALADAYQLSSVLDLFSMQQNYSNTDPSRIVVTPIDGDDWTEEDSNRISRIINVSNVTENDKMVDTKFPLNFGTTTSSYYFSDTYMREYYSQLPLLKGTAPQAKFDAVVSYDVIGYYGSLSLPIDVAFGNSQLASIVPDIRIVGIAKDDGRTKETIFFSEEALSSIASTFKINDLEDRITVFYDQAHTSGFRIDQIGYDSDITGTDAYLIDYEVDNDYYGVIDNVPFNVKSGNSSRYANYGFGTLIIGPDFLSQFSIETPLKQASVFVSDIMFRSTVASRLRSLGYRVVIPSEVGMDNIAVLKILAYLLVFLRNGLLMLFIGLGTYLVMRSMLRAKLKDYAILSTIGLDKKEIDILSLLELWLSFTLSFVVTLIALTAVRLSHLGLFSVLISNLNFFVIVAIYGFLLILSLYIIKKFTKYMKKKSLLSEVRGTSEL